MEKPQINSSQIEEIENMPWSPSLSSGDKLDLLLMKLGCKKATSIIMHRESKGANKALEMQLKKLGFSCAWRSDNQFINIGCIELIVGNDEASMKLLFTDGPKRHENYGELSGYPESAIAAFNTNDMSQMLQDADMPAEVKNEDWYELLHFALSKSNWREEIKTVEKWYELLNQYAPKFLETYISAHKERRIAREREEFGEKIQEVL